MGGIVKVRDMVLGQGMPKICVPITAETKAALLDDASAALAAGADLVEWRADHFMEVEAPGILPPLLEALRAVLGKTPLLFTIRTDAEGGHRALTPKTYLRLNKQAAQSGQVDLLDVEMMLSAPLCGELCDVAHQNGVKIVLSNHDFSATPPQEEILRRLQQMRRMGGDIVKIATLPHTPADVLALLCAGEEYRREEAAPPLISMAMGALGRVSRIAGRVSGSCLTFGTAGACSAPGQLAVAELRQILAALEQD